MPNNNVETVAPLCTQHYVYVYVYVDYVVRVYTLVAHTAVAVANYVNSHE